MDRFTPVHQGSHRVLDEIRALVSSKTSAPLRGRLSYLLPTTALPFVVDHLDLELVGNSSIGPGTWEDFHVTLEGNIFSTRDQEHPIGWIRRHFSIGEGIAEHSNLQITPSFRSLGFGRRVMRAFVHIYDAVGIRTAHVNATEGGRYFWARCGFDFDERQRKLYVDDVRELSEKLGVSLPYNAEQPWAIATQGGAVRYEDLVRYGRTHDLELLLGIDPPLDLLVPLGKALMSCGHLSGWDGYLDMTGQKNGGRAQLEAYCQVDDPPW